MERLGSRELEALGITHHQHGVENVLAIANLALLRGMAGRRGAGLLPIRGHSNVQGVGSVGFTPALKDAFAKALERAFGIEPAATPGWDTFAAMQAAAGGGVDLAWSSCRARSIRSPEPRPSRPFR